MSTAKPERRSQLEIRSQLSESGLRQVSALVARALSEVSVRSGGSQVAAAIGALDAKAFAALEKTVLGVDDPEPGAIIDKLRAHGIPDIEIVDLYVPAVGHDLGEKWLDDEAGFAEVTVAASRLQAICRRIEEDWRDWVEPAADAPTFLIVVPAGENHTLGAAVTANQCRRAGMRVETSICRPDAEVLRALDERRFDVVGISAASNIYLPDLRRLIAACKATRTRPTVALGGGLVNLRRSAAATVGADILCGSANEVIRQCGLTGSTSRRRGAGRQSGSSSEETRP